MRWPMACGVWADAHHQWNVWSVNIGIEQADCMAEL